MLMMYDFFLYALLAGMGVALVSGPLGCLVIWRRLSFFGDTLAHAGLLGVALALFTGLNLSLAVALVGLITALLLVWLLGRMFYPSDLVLGLLSHSALALGLVALAYSSQPADLLGFLFGDILAVSQLDLVVIYLGGALVLLLLALMWRQLFAASVNVELAQAEGMRPSLVNLAFVLMLALVVAMAIKIVGVLLIAALLLIPAATVRRLSATPEVMAALAAVCGVLSVIGGLFASLYFDSPSGPSIVVAALVLFVLANIIRRGRKEH